MRKIEENIKINNAAPISNCFELIFKIGGAVFVLLSVAANPYWIGKLAGKAPSSLTILLAILFFEILLALIGGGMYFKNSWFAARWKEIILFLAASFFTFLLLEVGVRILYKAPPGGWYGYPSGLYLPDNKLGFKLKPGFSGFFPNPPFDKIAIKINSKGLRDNEHDYAKPKGVTRILGLGDSVTFGSGIPFESTYLNVLEREFSQNGKKAEVIKSGVNSYEFDQERTYFNEEGKKYRPDIVLVGMVLNDIKEITPEIIQEDVSLHKKMLENPLLGVKENNSRAEKIGKWCRICGLVLSSATSIENRSAREQKNISYFEWSIKRNWAKSWPNFEKRILALKKEVEGSGAKLALVVFPYVEQFANNYDLSKMPQDKLKEMGRRYDVTVIDLLPYLDKKDWRDFYLLGDNVHLNEVGNGLAADVLSKELMEKDLMK